MNLHPLGPIPNRSLSQPCCLMSPTCRMGYRQPLRTGCFVLFVMLRLSLYGPVGTEVIHPSTYDVLRNQCVFNAAFHEPLASLYPTAGQQAIPLQPDDRQLAIARFREEHQRAISFDDEDDEEYFPDLLPPQQFSTPAIIHATSPTFLPIDMGPVDYPTAPALDPNPSASKPLDPAAPAFEYQPINRYIHDMATEADQKALQAQEPIPDAPAPEFAAEAASAPAPQKASQAQDPIPQVPEPEFPAEAASAPAPQPHLTAQGTIMLRKMYYHPVNEKKREKAAELERAALEAQSLGRSNGGGVANGNGAARSQKPQNGSSASKLSGGPYRQSRSNGSLATTNPLRGPSRSNSSTKPSPINGSSMPRRPHRNSPGPARFGPSTPTRTGSNSPANPATTDTSLSTSPTPSLRPPHKLKDAASPSNSVRRPATRGPSRGSRTPTGTTGAVRAYAGGATPQRSPPAPTTGTTGVSAAATSNRRGSPKANSWRQLPKAGNAGNSTSASQSSKAAPRSPTQLPTQTGASNGTADAGPSTGRRSVLAEPARTGDQESAVPTRPPMPRPAETSTDQGVANAGSSTEGSSAQVMGAGRNSGHGIYETRRGKFEAMRGRWRRGGRGL